MTGVLARIFLRYASAALIAKGVMSPDLGDWLRLDPDIASGAEVAVGLAVAGITEGWYFLARKFGWAT